MELYNHLHICAAQGTKNGKPLFYIPKSIVLDKNKKIDIKFPTLCKRITACSSREAHQMILIPSVKDISLIRKYIKDDPVMLQEFIQHDGVIVKVYVADGEISATTRPSFKNLDHNADIVYFDSQRIPKSFEDIEATEDIDRIFLRSDPGGIHGHKEALLDKGKLQAIANSLYNQLGLTFFGFDVLLQSDTNAYFVVDVNYFPSYKDVDNFHSMLVRILKKRLSL
ncbi:inositol-tetrakisphosphate 1-kinase [Pilobolus umbonatus]|nr:inositol-tetrakisphosphate 1-kinase [Pilobolus umbonatus]